MAVEPNLPKPKPLEEADSSLTSDLEFVLPRDIPAGAERIEAETAV